MTVDTRLFGPARLAILCAFVAVGVTSWCVLRTPVDAHSALGLDFHAYRDFFVRATNHQQAYSFRNGPKVFYYPFALTLLNVTRIGGVVSFGVWSILSALAWVAAVILSRPWMPERYRSILTIFFAAAFGPMWATLLVGQINAFVALAIVAMFRASERDEQVLAGIALACAIGLKVSPAVLLVYLLTLRQWKAIGSTLVTLVVLTILPVLQFGVGILPAFLRLEIQFGHMAFVRPFNESVASTLSVLVGTSHASLIFLAAKALFALLTVGVLAASWRLDLAHNEVQRHSVFAVLCLLMVVFSPFAWYHHLVFLLLPFIFLLHRAGLRWFVLAMVIVEIEQLLDQVLLMPSVPLLLLEVVMFALFVQPLLMRSRQPRIRTAQPELADAHA